MPTPVMIADFRDAPRAPTARERLTRRYREIAATIPKRAGRRQHRAWRAWLWVVVQTSTRQQLARMVWPWRAALLKARSERPTVRGRRAVTAGA